ncbi:putative short-chain oxidoreductase [Sporolactobacillus inulinus]|uniref:Putative short-chain oxidoreductase n=1 Tax=Sporolactobacillus inulinus TaxID=2078 RepID=A0A4Y1ZAK2_9BACL|nr:putative short-chain oxidoreductase [Sporolactobacillus inulinus]
MTNYEKHVIVTGASSGIGRATAVALAGQGYNVHLIGRNAERLANVQTETRRKGVQSTTYQLELTDKTAVQQVFDEIYATTGRIDGLVNAAGIFYTTNVLDYEDPSWKEIMDVNFYGTLYPSLALLPKLIAQGFGSIVNVTSVDALTESRITMRMRRRKVR